MTGETRPPEDGTTGSASQISASPPYVSFNTFKTLVEWLKSEGVPLRFDRSFWQAKFSGSTGTQLMAALRFLGLLGGDRPLPDLESLVDATADERRFILKELLKDAYSAVPFDDLDRATPSMVRGWFRAYPVDGHTARKAISFFVNAAREAEIPMSNAVRKMAKSRTPAPPGLTRYKRQERSDVASPEADQHSRTPHSGPPVRATGLQGRPPSQTTIPLESGGTVTVGLAVDLFQLSDRDREFVLTLVDLIQGFQARPEQSTQGDKGAAEVGKK